jgi:hypothetical protein
MNTSRLQGREVNAFSKAFFSKALAAVGASSYIALEERSGSSTG